MKILISLFLAAMLSASPVWLTDMATAKKEAVRSNKFILVNFSGSDWCRPCIQMEKEIFNSARFKNYASDNLVLVKADFPRLGRNRLSEEQTAKNEALSTLLNPEGKLPFTIVLDANGNVLKSWEGFPDLSPEKFVKEIGAVIGK